VAKIMASKPAISLPGGADMGTTQKKTEEQAATKDEEEKRTPAGGERESQSVGGNAEIAVKEEIDWDARSDEAAVTPPLIDDEGQHPEEWRDIPGPEGMRQPTTPELLVDLDDTSGDQPSADEIVEGIKHTRPSATTFATIFHNMTVPDIRKEWGMPASPSTSEASAAEKKEAEEATGEGPCTGAQGEPPLDQDELVQQVMGELKQSGGTPAPPERSQAGEDLLDIEIESGATIRPASQQAKTAGEKLGQRLRSQEEDRRRTLRVGGLTVKLPPAKTGEAARGTLTAKVKKVSKALGEEKPLESLTSRMKRVAAFMDLGEKFQHKVGEGKVYKELRGCYTDNFALVALLIASRQRADALASAIDVQVEEVVNKEKERMKVIEDLSLHCAQLQRTQ
ncbi:PPOX1, partial [Symbiodinium sp. KB8]